MAATKATKPLKIGIICEGQVDGADEMVFRQAVKLLCPSATVDIVPSGNRRVLFHNAPTQAKLLLEDGCVAVFVAWDVIPDWPDQDGNSGCKPQCKQLLENLASAGMANMHILPLAIREELEAWLLADGDALSAAMSKSPHKVKVGHEKSPDMVSKPKARLRKLYRTERVGTYNESIDARKIAANWTTTQRLENSQSFKHFARKIRSLCPSGK